VDVDSFALERAYEENYDFDVDNIIALVNIGASITNINIIKDGESVFTRNILSGGDSITQALQTKLNVSFEEAEMIKIEGSDDHDSIQGEALNYLEPIFWRQEGRLIISVQRQVSQISVIFSSVVVAPKFRG